jgi:16S rRNA (cytosine1402-N4)-methyltransferase
MIYQAIHKPVLLQEVLQYLIRDKKGIYVDCTVGEGGHSEAILSRLSAKGRLIGIDKDGEQLEAAQERLKKYGDRCLLFKEDFRNLTNILNAYEIDFVDGILMDLGVSSYQLSDPQRGLSFQRDGPLDMRFDRSEKISAVELINRLSQSKLYEIIKKYGEERWAQRIAREIVRYRKHKRIETTKDLSQLIAKVVPGSRRSRIHPATRTFQAIRVAVNKEIEGLKETIMGLASRLKEGGRIVIISFHSLEDRQVKDAFRSLANTDYSSQGELQCSEEKKLLFRILTRRPIRPTREEMESNSRSRSARMRVTERELVNRRKQNAS